MFDTSDSGRQGIGRALRSFLAGGGWLIAAGGLALLIGRKFFAVHTNTAAGQPVLPSVNPAHNEQRPKTAFEPTDWSLGPVALVYVGALVLLAVSCFVLIAAYPGSLPDVARTLRIKPPGPRLQTDPARDLQKFRAKEEERLNSYYWIDKEKGVVHIPIDQAMKKLATTGVAGFAKEQP